MKIKQLVLIVILILSLIGFLAPSLFAAEGPNVGGEVAGAVVLEPVQNPGILQTNPFYFVKEWSRGIHRAFTFSPVAKLQFDFQVAADKAAELRRLEEIGTVNSVNFGNAVLNYGASLKTLAIRLEATNSSISPEILSDLASGITEQEQLLGDLKSRHADLSSDIEQVQAYLSEILEVVSSK